MAPTTGSEKKGFVSVRPAGGERVLTVETGPSVAPIHPAIREDRIAAVQDHFPEHRTASGAALKWSWRLLLAFAVLVIAGVLYTLNAIGGIMAFTVGVLMLVLYIVVGGGSEWMAARIRTSERAMLERMVDAGGPAPTESTARRAARAQIEAEMGAGRLVPVDSLLRPGISGIVPNGVTPTSAADIAQFRARCAEFARRTGWEVAGFRGIDGGASFCVVTLQGHGGIRRDILLHTVHPLVAVCEDVDQSPRVYVDDDAIREAFDDHVVLSPGTLAQPLSVDDAARNRLMPSELALLAEHRPATLGELVFNRFE
ncbi:MAG: hypothetical protein KF745_13725 [Phycisphaeraceae bacterium]|nr:hypothetical protein [Phycisphaeraceae bacterium]